MRDRMEVGTYAQSTIISYVRAVRDLMEHTQKLPQACSEAEVIAYLNDIRQRQPKISCLTPNTHCCPSKTHKVKLGILLKGSAPHNPDKRSGLNRRTVGREGASLSPPYRPFTVKTYLNTHRQ